ncbi:agamous-like MADS-box protein AGL61 [Silene latifolia]|uniref:agamous-like MADS-box protein AGL61 n=1 Tax=Silene latifolia TaxID=37657 RepID=UPI003D771B0F
MPRNSNIGRRRSTLTRIEIKDDRLITFSKRRSGIYKKASELIALCDAEIGILIFSESNKPYTYGAPDFETVANCYLGYHNPPSTNPTIDNIVQAFKKEKLQEMYDVINDLSSHLDFLIKEEEQITKIVAPIKDQFWWEAPLDNMNQQEMDHLVELMEKLNVKANEKGEEIASMNP